MYPLSFDAELAAIEQAARLERAGRARLLAEARLAHPTARRSAGSRARWGPAAAAWLRAASVWLAEVADSLDAAVPALGGRQSFGG